MRVNKLFFINNNAPQAVPNEKLVIEGGHVTDTLSAVCIRLIRLLRWTGSRREVHEVLSLGHYQTHQSRVSTRVPLKCEISFPVVIYCSELPDKERKLLIQLYRESLDLDSPK